MAIRESTYRRFLAGEVTERITLRQSLARYYGYKCNVCSISEWNGKQLTLQVDHINGHAGNNMPNNLRLICPNCHAQTETFGGRNKGKGRKSQGLKTR
jgi:5-methylcytosine-specific restriction endonuclease McrA